MQDVGPVKRHDLGDAQASVDRKPGQAKRGPPERERKCRELLLLLPQPLEAPARHPRVVHGVPRVPMPEVILHRPEIRASVREIVSA